MNLNKKKRKMAQLVCVKALFKAVKKGQTDIVGKLLVGNNSDLVRAVDIKGQTPLHLACLQNDSNMVALLLSKNADYKLKNYEGQTSFDIAKDFGNLDIIKRFLLDKQKRLIPSELAHFLRMAVVTSDFELLSIILENYMDTCSETDDNGDSILHFSVEKNNFEVVKRLVYSGVKVNCKNNNGQTPLHIASKLNFSLLARHFLHSDPDTVNVQDSTGNTALHFAAQKDNAAFMGELVTEGARVDLANQDGMTPLHIAIQCHCLKAFYKLLAHNADINVRDKEGNTPLHMSVIKEDLVLTRKLVRNDANVNCQNIYGQTPLHIAFERNNLNLIKFFMHKSLFNAFDARDSNGNTLLHIASLRDNHKLIDELVNRGAMLDLTNCNGQSPLHIAIQNDCHQAFDKLIYQGANVNLKDGEGKTPLHISVSRGVLSVVGRLVNSGADLELRDHYGQTPIHYAANCESLEVLKYLYFSGSETSTNYRQQTLIHVALESCPYSGIPDMVCRKCWYVIDWLLYMGVDINAQDMKGETALHYGARYGCVSMLKHLCEQDVKNCEILLELQNEDGQTALHLAALYDWQVFDHLLGEKADPNSKDYRGVTPFEILTEKYECIEEEPDAMNTSLPSIHYFVSSRLLNIVDLLLERNLSIESKYNGDTPLIYAVDKGLKKETQYLIERGADVNAKNDIGLTALHIAIQKSDITKSYVNIAHSLMLGGADVNVKARDGKTALHMALEKERVYPFLLRNLLDNGAIVDVVDFERKTPLDYISSDNMENPLVKTLLRHNLIMLKTVNMLSIPVDFQYNGFEDFHKCCLEEIELMKAEKYGRNSLFDIFLKFGNPTYIFNRLLEMKIKSFQKNENEIYPIYGSLLKQTYKRAIDRYKLLQGAQGFFTLLKNSPFQPSLPDEMQRMILYNLCESDLETLVDISQVV